MKIYVDGQYIEHTTATPEQRLLLMRQRPLLYHELFNVPPLTVKKAAMYTPFQVYQIFYDEKSREKLDNGFIPYDNSGATHNFENDVILDLWLTRRNEWISKKFVGVLSWRFYEKTERTAKELYRVLRTTTADVVTISPKLYSGQKHPFVREGFVTVTQMCRTADEHHLFPFTLYQYPVSNIVWCNYWVARPEVFDLYCTKYLNKVITFFRDNRNETIRRQYDAMENHRDGKPYLSMTFFLEGLFSVFLDEEHINTLTL